MARLALIDPVPDPAQVRLGDAADPRLKKSGLADQIGFALRIAQAAVWSDLVETLAPFDLRPQQYAALLIVAANPGCKQQDIAASLGVQRPNIVALVDELATRRLIDRVVNADDRRSYSLTLTEDGRRLLKAANPAHAAHLERVNACIGPEDSEKVRAMLGRLAGIGGSR